MICNQANCERPAIARYTWPGHDEAGVCAVHLPGLRSIADAMGLHLQIRRIEPAWTEALAAVRAAHPPFYSCGCSHLKVEAGLCDVFGPDGKERVP